ncbi:putative fruit bromelain [Helianthus annuus]|nr:putative fruit bromelain [Helianthus annuus]
MCDARPLIPPSPSSSRPRPLHRNIDVEDDPKEGRFEAMAAASVKSDEERFEEWMKQYNKIYKTEAEKQIRFKSFQINLREIDAHLANKSLKAHTKGQWRI